MLKTPKNVLMTPRIPLCRMRHFCATMESLITHTCEAYFVFVVVTYTFETLFCDYKATCCSLWLEHIHVRTFFAIMTYTYETTFWDIITAGETCFCARIETLTTHTYETNFWEIITYKWDKFCARMETLTTHTCETTFWDIITYKWDKLSARMENLWHIHVRFGFFAIIAYILMRHFWVCMDVAYQVLWLRNVRVH